MHLSEYISVDHNTFRLLECVLVKLVFIQVHVEVIRGNDAHFLSNSGSCGWLVSRHHDDLDASLSADFHRTSHTITRRVIERHKTNEGVAITEREVFLFFLHIEFKVSRELSLIQSES